MWINLSIYLHSLQWSPPPPYGSPVEHYHPHNNAPVGNQIIYRKLFTITLSSHPHYSSLSSLTWIFNTPTTWADDWLMVNFHSDLHRPFLTRENKQMIRSSESRGTIRPFWITAESHNFSLELFSSSSTLPVVKWLTKISEQNSRTKGRNFD